MMDENGNFPTILNTNEEDASIYLFEDLLQQIGNEMDKQQFKKLKHSLIGHVDQNLLKKIRNPKELIFYLRVNRLLSHKKLAFFRKLLEDIPGCQKCIGRIDNYREMISQQKMALGKIFLFFRQLFLQRMVLINSSNCF